MIHLSGAMLLKYFDMGMFIYTKEIANGKSKKDRTEDNISTGTKAPSGNDQHGPDADEY
jgi:hypothetical protein